MVLSFVVVMVTVKLVAGSDSINSAATASWIIAIGAWIYDHSHASLPAIALEVSEIRAQYV